MSRRYLIWEGGGQRLFAMAAVARRGGVRRTSPSLRTSSSTSCYSRRRRPALPYQQQQGRLRFGHKYAALTTFEQDERDVKPEEASASSPSPSSSEYLSAVPTNLLPKLLCLADLREKVRLRGGEKGNAETGEVPQHTLAEHARGLANWSRCLEKGTLPLLAEEEADQLQEKGSKPWPSEPARTMILAAFARLKLPQLSARFPQIHRAAVAAVLEAVIEYERAVAGVEDEAGGEDGAAAEQQESQGAKSEKAGAPPSGREADPKYQRWLAAKRAKEGGGRGGGPGGPSASAGETALPGEEGGEGWWSGVEAAAAEAGADERALKSAVSVARSLVRKWEPAVSSLNTAAAAFSFVDVLLGGRTSSFDVSDGASVWRRKGWDKLDSFRENLERSKPLRDLVRSLGRGAGWGPLRRSPVQHLDLDRGRDGLLRSILEQQETRGLCRSDDLARMLPSEACLLAKGRTTAVAKRLFFSKFVQQSLLSYERDGWHQQPTRVPNPLVREVRPTADRGPILLCVDTSGSMRGVREKVAKALVLECMRAAKEQERGCFVYCFSGPRDVRELELSVDAEGSVDR